MSATTDVLRDAREALARGAWAEARTGFEAVLAAEPSGEAWEALSWARFWLDDADETAAAREAAYRAYRAEGNTCRAALMAAFRGSDAMDFHGEAAVAAGWYERAARLLEGRPDCEEAGWLALMRASYAAAVDNAPRETAEHGREAVRIGRTLGVPDLEAVGLAYEGAALVAEGRLDEGVPRLDEACAIASGEEFVTPLSPGWALCCVVGACAQAGDFARASQWSAVMRVLAEKWSARVFAGVCRTAYGRVLTTAGDWGAADAELTQAVEHLAASRPAMAGVGLVRLGELRARQGRVEEARTCFEAGRPAPAALVGLGSLALDEGDGNGALAHADRALRRLGEESALDRLPALELRARGQIALGELEPARETVTVLEAAAGAIGTPYMRALALLVRAELCAAAGEAEGARHAAEDAADLFAGCSAPYDEARARLALAGALGGLGRVAAAEAEREAARRTFAELGAQRDVERATAGLPGAGASPGAGTGGELSPRELDVLRLVAQGLSDAEIAQRLVVSPHTVHRHVANIRAKLRLPSRAAAVAYAAREGLL